MHFDVLYHLHSMISDYQGWKCMNHAPKSIVCVSVNDATVFRNDDGSTVFSSFFCLNLRYIYNHRIFFFVSAFVCDIHSIAIASIYSL